MNARDVVGLAAAGGLWALVHMAERGGRRPPTGRAADGDGSVRAAGPGWVGPGRWRPGAGRPAPPRRSWRLPMAPASVRHRPGPVTASARSRGRAPFLAPARWATSRDLAALIVGGDAAPTGRVVVGTLRRSWGRPGATVAVERGHSLLVVGPTQSGKTTCLAVPAVLRWPGPVVAASVKGDLARATIERRSQVGEVAVYDPTGATGLEPAAWSPLYGAGTWSGARRVAKRLTDVARAQAGTMTDGDFWFSLAAKLLAPLLLAAALSHRSMCDVARWTDEQEQDEVVAVLEARHQGAALRALQATWQRESRQRSSVYTTAEAAIEAFSDPDVAAGETRAAAAGPAGFSVERFVGPPADGAQPTLYLCAPAHDQQRLRPLFAALVAQVVETAFERAGRTGAPLDPPLLVVLDEAANVAPLAELDVLASTAAGHGVQLVTVWQDLSQLQARYGTKASSVVNNHRAKVFLSGIADPATLEHASMVIGDTEDATAATTVDQFGRRSDTDSTTSRRLLPPDGLRRLPPGRAVLVHGHLPPALLALRPWFSDPALVAKLGSAATDGDTRRSESWSASEGRAGGRATP